MSNILSYTSKICICFMLAIRTYISPEIFLSVLQKSGGSEYKIRTRISTIRQLSSSYLYPTDCLIDGTLVAACSG